MKIAYAENDKARAASIAVNLLRECVQEKEMAFEKVNARDVGKRSCV